MAKTRFNKRISVKKVISLILGGLVVFGCVFGAVALFGNDKKDVKPGAFSVGGLDDTGTYVAQTNTIFTEDLIECQGLEISPDVKCTSTYKVFLYDHKKDLVEATDELAGNYKLTNSAVRYCRIMIIPEASTDEDFKISFWEVRGYANDFEITVNRKQNFIVKNYFEADKADKVANVDLTYEDSVGFGVSKLVSVSGVAALDVIFESAQPESIDLLFFTKVADDESEVTYEYVSTVSTGAEATEVTVNVPEGATHMIVNYPLTESFAIYAAD